jgi:hypothetical protein
MKDAPRTRSITGSLTARFRHKKPLTTFDRRPNDYYGRYDSYLLVPVIPEARSYGTFGGRKVAEG